MGPTIGLGVWNGRASTYNMYQSIWQHLLLLMHILLLVACRDGGALHGQRGGQGFPFNRALPLASTKVGLGARKKRPFSFCPIFSENAFCCSI